MSRAEDTKYGRCQATASSTGDQCGRAAVGEHGKCDFHGGKSSGPKTDGGKETSSKNAITHGAQADPHGLKDHLDDEDEAWIDSLTEAYLSESSYSADDPQAERIEMTVVMAWQERSGRAELIKEGLEREKVVGVSDSGAPISDLTGHHLNDVVASLNSDIRMNLKDLGFLNDPQSQTADAIGAISILSEEHNGGD